MAIVIFMSEIYIKCLMLTVSKKEMVNMSEEREFIIRSISFTRDVLEKADYIVKKRLIAGINNRSGLVEYALRRVFKEVFKEKESVDQ